MQDRTCSIDGCDKPRYGKRWCNTHYMRWRRHGDPHRGGAVKRQSGTGQPCTVPQCSAPVVASELCESHYRRAKRHGTPEAGRPAPGALTDAERFWGKVNKTATCWLWTDAPNSSGYGTLKVDGMTEMAHRYALQLAGHELTEGLTVDHLCRVRLCVNPDHLEEVTYGENLRRAAAARPGVVTPVGDDPTG